MTIKDEEKHSRETVSIAFTRGAAYNSSEVIEAMRYIDSNLRGGKKVIIRYSEKAIINEEDEDLTKSNDKKG